MTMQFIMIAVSILLAMLYACLIIRFRIGWNRLGIQNTADYLYDNDLLVSVLIPVRNEANNISHLLDDLVKQRISPNAFEVIIIDDHSEDSTISISETHRAKFRKFRILSLCSTSSLGKKAALTAGVEAAGGLLVVTTDADCRVRENWLITIAAYYKKHKHSIIICPVFIEGQSFFGQLQSLEYASLMASAAGSAGIGHPILCSGANLAFEHSIFTEYSQAIVNQTPSGDDMFLLIYLKKLKNHSIGFLKSRETVVTTKAQSDLKAFINQRIRWTSKNRFYEDSDVIYSAVLVFIINIVLVFLIAISLFNNRYFYVLMFVFILKTMVDFILLHNYVKFYDRKKLLRFFLLTAILYPFYVFVIGLIGSVLPFVWKGRTCKR